MQSTSTVAEEAERLQAALERLVRLVRGVATAGGLSQSAASLLARLEREGPQRVTDLASAERVSQPAVTQLVARLERDGLVQRAARGDDARVVVIAISSVGRAVLAERRRERAAALATLLQQLSEDERRALAAAVPTLHRLTELSH